LEAMDEVLDHVGPVHEGHERVLAMLRAVVGPREVNEAELDSEEEEEAARQAAPEAPEVAAPATPERLDAPADQEISASCPICMEPFSNAPELQRVARVLSCGHLVCTRCVRAFRRSKGINARRLNDSDRRPCVTCRRRVHWAKLPACKTVAYLYGQLELANASKTEILKAQPESRKRARRNSDSETSPTQMAAKMKKLADKANAVFADGSAESNSGADRDLIKIDDSTEEIMKSDEKSERVKALKEQFNDYYSKMNQILDELSESSMNIPNVPPEA
ncbi:hypothetical protein PFISCL1PPCAC_7664, partial [Pristionchus fissidentatus]